MDECLSGMGRCRYDQREPRHGQRRDRDRRASDESQVHQARLFHAEELAVITAQARACGLTPTRFIRETALGAIPKAARHADTDPLLCELARIGRSLDHLAQAARTGIQVDNGATVAARLSTALDAYEAAVRQLVHDRQPGRRSAPRSAA